MAADSNIFAQYLRPAKSMQDYGNDMDAAEQNKLTLAASRMKAQQDQQAMSDDNALRSAYQQSGGDKNALLKILQGGGQYKAAAALEKSMAEQAKATADLGKTGADTDKTKMETTIKRLEHGASILSTATDDQTYAIALRELESVFPGATKEMPPQFDPQVVASKLASGQTIKDKLAAQLAQATQAQTVVRDTQTNDRGVASNLTAIRGQDRQSFDNAASRGVQKRGQDMVDSRARDMNTIARDLGIQEKELKIGEMQAKADDRARSKQASVSSVENQIGVIDKALKHPGLSAATGLSGSIDPRNYIPGTDATDFRVVLDQIGGAAFLQAFESLKGGGAITEVEGKRATDAIARLSRAQSDDEFKKSLKELRGVMAMGYKKMAGKDYQGANSRSDAGPVDFGSLK